MSEPKRNQRVALIDDPSVTGVVVRVRKAARRSFYHIDVRIDDPAAEIRPSISTCWMPL